MTKTMHVDLTDVMPFQKFLEITLEVSGFNQSAVVVGEDIFAFRKSLLPEILFLTDSVIMESLCDLRKQRNLTNGVCCLRLSDRKTGLWVVS